MRVPSCVSLALVLVVGCDAVFGLRDPLPRDGQADDAGGDARSDTGPVLEECENGSGHDEDGDLLDDVCDSCPGVANHDNADADSDGIGDACDPLPANPCTTRYDFFSFARANPRLMLPAAGWTMANDDLRAMAGERSFVTFSGAFFAASIRASVSVESMLGAVVVGTDLAFETNGTFASGLLCQYFSSAPAFSDRAYLNYFNGQLGQMGVMPVDVSTKAPVDVVMDVTSRRDGPSRTCLITPGLATPLRPSLTYVASSQPRGVGIAIENASATFHWVDVIDLSTCDAGGND